MVGKQFRKLSRIDLQILKRVRHHYRTNAKARGYSFRPSLETVFDLIIQDCHYCGTKPKKMIADYNGLTVTRNGMDRKDNKKGYLKSNLLPCCQICNRAKRDMNYEDFIKWINSLKGGHDTPQY